MSNQFIKIRVTKLQKEVIKNKAHKAGLTVSEYLRRLAFEKEIRARLTPTEIECYKNLSKFALNFKNIANLFKKYDKAGVHKAALETAELIKTHLDKLK